MAPATHPGATATDLADPSVLLNQFSGQASWIGMEFDLSAIPSGIGIQINGENAQTQAYFMGLTSNRANYFNWAGANSDQGTIGFILNRTAQATSILTAQAANQGSSSAEDVRKTWSQARSLTWDSTPYQAPTGSADIRIYRMKMDQTAGLVIHGQ